MRLLAAFLLIIYAAQNGILARDHIVSLTKGENFELTIEQGDKINFHVRDNNKHVLTIQGESQSFASLSPKDSAKQQFNEAGEFIVTDSANLYSNKIIVNKKQQDQERWYDKDAKDHANKMAATKDFEKHQNEDLQNTNDAQNNANAKPNSANKEPNTANKAKPSSDVSDTTDTKDTKETNASNKAKPSTNTNDAKPSTNTNDAKPSTNVNDAKPKTDETKTKAGSPKSDAKPKTDQTEENDDQAETKDDKTKQTSTTTGNSSSTLVANVMLLAISATLALIL
ncbi:hypothetical protein ACTA71_006844 [Dictyostelium dimigraforme]